MDDILNDLFGKNRKLILCFFIVYILITVSIIVYIWWPKEKNYLEYSNVDIEKKQEEVSRRYANLIDSIFTPEYKDSFKHLISNDYLRYLGKSAEEVTGEFENEGFFKQFNKVPEVSLYRDGDTYIYALNIYNDYAMKQINIVETYPYEYKLTFGDFYSYTEPNRTVTQNKIEFKIKSIYKSFKYIKLAVEIENKNDTYVRFNFNNSSVARAVLKDGKSYAMSNVVSTTNYTEVPSKASIVKDFVFEIPIQLHGNIDYIIFSDIDSQNLKFNAKISI